MHILVSDPAHQIIDTDISIEIAGNAQIIMFPPLVDLVINVRLAADVRDIQCTTVKSIYRLNRLL
jgi:hypothetical protein